MYTLKFKPRATKMVQEAYDWYQEQRDGLGELFLIELDKALDKIEKWPLIYAATRNSYRQALVQTFPYVVVFEIQGEDIVVYAVFHTSRNPRKKLKD
jgi:plasmid stabilization system protein ParE